MATEPSVSVEKPEFEVDLSLEEPQGYLYFFAAEADVEGAASATAERPADPPPGAAE